jgi:hypothetical protein
MQHMDTSKNFVKEGFGSIVVRDLYKISNDSSIRTIEDYFLPHCFFRRE